MRWLRAAWRTRTARAATVAVALLAAGLCLVPGFDALNYYASFALALAGAPLAGLVGAADARRALEASPATPRPVFLGAARAAVPLVLVPPALLLLNALRVRNCDPVEGLAFYAVGAATSMLFASQVGAAAALVTRGPRRAALLTLGVWLAFLARDAAFLYLEPPIFAYDPFVGFFSGAVYDDVIVIDGRLLAYRAFNLAQLALVWGLAWLAWSPADGRPTRAALLAAPARRWAVLALLALAWAGGWGLRGVVGYEIDRDALRAALGGTWRAPGLVLHYDAAAFDEEAVARLAEDHLWRLHQLDEALGGLPPGEVTSWVYGSNARKRELMGGARVAIAKPWQGEVHLSPGEHGDPVVLHELAHVVLGRFAPGPLHLPAALGVVPHMALIEGAAEALEWSGGLLTPHAWSAAMRRAGLAPALADILGPEGFWTQPAGRAYTLAGSFMRWLLDTRGVAPFLAVYADGDFAAAYGEPLADLVAAWERFLDGLELPEEAVALARQRFSRPAIFLRVCPLEIARLDAQADRLEAEGRPDDAAMVRRTILGFVPDEPFQRLALIRILARTADPGVVRREAEALEALEAADPTTRALARELVGDAAWRAGDRAAAREAYEAARPAPLGEDGRRNLLARLDVLGSPAREPILGPYLLGPAGDADEALAYLTDAAADLPGDPLALYLLGRRLAQEARAAEAVGPLRSALALYEAGGAADDTSRDAVTREAWRLLARALYDTAAFGAAAEAYGEAAARTPWEGRRATLLDWRARALWRASGEPARHGARAAR